MAGENKESDEKEIKIPVFSVLKNGVVLKNIFLNNPQWEPKPPPETGDGVSNQEDDPILIGRHPDCHMVLDHPSISRFHLEIRAEPASQKLWVTDRSSVHGTWVSGNKIQPNILVELLEGDTVKLGASTRVYRLQWIPLRCAFEMERPLPALLEENEMENPNEVWAEEMPSAPPMPESMMPLSSGQPSLWPLEKEYQSPVRNEMQEEMSSLCSVEPMPETMGFSSPMTVENRTPEKNDGANEVRRDYLSRQASEKKMNQMEEQMSSFCSVDPMPETAGFSLPMGVENRTPEKNVNANEMQRDYLSPQALEEKKSMPSSLLSRRSKSISFLRVQTGRNKEKIGESNCDAKAAEENQKENVETFEDGKISETFCRVLFGNVNGNQEEEEEEETFISDKENVTPVSSRRQMSRKWYTEMQNSPLNAFAVITLKEELFHPEKETWTPEAASSSIRNKPMSGNCYKKDREERDSSDKENLVPEFSSGHKLNRSLMEMQSASPNLIAALNMEEDAFNSDKENWTPEAPTALKSKKKLLRDLVKINREEEEEAFPSDKENLIPDFLRSRKSKKLFSESHDRIEREIMERRKERIPFQSLLNSPLRDSSSLVDKERVLFNSPMEKSPLGKICAFNKAQRLVDEDSRYSSRNGSPLVDKERVPFHSLMESSPLRNSSPANNSQRMVDRGSKCSSSISGAERMTATLSNAPSQSVEKKIKWNIVVDTDCFLNEESRKSLQLLEGLKGTHLIIPMMVIRELDCLKRRESLFRKVTKEASAALQWVEECMVKSSWWIHVQSSSETMPVAPTPPASPHIQLGSENDELGIGAAFSTCGSIMEIVSPTAEDHILDCALLFRGAKDDGQLVLLTNSVTLKIKAMAEGLLCETAKEFRESLVNPFSQRFLWADSSPRGFTWSCTDEMGLVDYYYHQCPAARKTAKAAEGVKGLKLILLHNSHYGKTNSVGK